MGLGPTVPSATDVLVIGGGVLGTATAFHLSARTDEDLTLVEKSNIAAGATGDSSAQLRHHYYGDELYTRMALDGHAFFRAFEEHTGHDLALAEHRQARFGRRSDTSGAEIRQGYEVLASLDVPVSMYEADEIAPEFPLLEFTDPIDFAVTDESAGYTDGTDAATGMAAAARRQGTRVVTDVGVETIEAADGTVQGVETDHGRIDCGAVVIAAGPWSHKLARTVGVDLPIAPSREQVLLLDPPADVTDEELETIPMHKKTSPRGRTWYMRRDFGGEILLATHFRRDSADPDAYRNQVDEAVKLEAFELLVEHIPRLADAAVVGEYCGIYANTPDDGFIIDQVGPAGCYALVGAGHALKHAPVIGRLAADLVLEGESDYADLAAFAADRFEDPSPHWALEPEPVSSDP